MSIQIYILSKLTENNSYPYQLKKELSEPIPLAEMTSLTESKLYYHFESLTKQGLVVPVEVIKEDNRPDKQVFAITELGRRILPEKIYMLFEKAKTITDMIVGIACIHHVDRSQVIQILEYKLSVAERNMKKIDQYRSYLDDRMHKLQFLQFLDRYHEEKRQHELESLKLLIEQLRKEAY